MRLLLLSGLIVASAACGGPNGTRVQASDYNRMPAAQPAGGTAAAIPPAFPRAETTAKATSSGSATSSDELVNEKNGLDKRNIDLGRRREDLHRNLSELEQKRQRTSLEHTGAQATEALDLERAELEAQIAAQDLERFLSVDQPRRLAEDALGLAASEDGLLETREELAQLEMMYGDADLGDATAEIVLSRTRRRLERGEESHRLRLERSVELKELTLPRDLERLQLEHRAKTVALESARRTIERGRLSREEALRGLDFEAHKLVREGEDIERDDDLLMADRKRWEKKSAEATAPKREPSP